jgi:hypothetical protein
MTERPSRRISQPRPTVRFRAGPLGERGDVVVAAGYDADHEAALRPPEHVGDESAKLLAHASATGSFV